MKRSDMEFLIKQNSNFYNEYRPELPAYTKLLEAYDTTFQWLYEQTDLLEINTLAHTNSLLEIMPYALIDIKKAKYNRDFALQLNKQNLTVEDTTLLLYNNGYYETFFPTTVESSKVYDATFKLQFDDHHSLLVGKDYVISDNKLFLLPDFIIQHEAYNELHAFRIVINNYFLEKNFGTLNGLYFNDLIVREDVYRIVLAFERVMSSMMTIASIRDAVRESTEWSTFDVFDQHSYNVPLHRQVLFRNRLISPHIFFVVMPEEAVSNEVKVAVVRFLLEKVKEAQTKYVEIYKFIRKDLVVMSSKNPTSDELRVLTYGNRYDDESLTFDFDVVNNTYDCYDELDSTKLFESDTAIKSSFKVSELSYDNTYDLDFYYDESERKIDCYDAII